MDEFGDYDYETPQALDLALINEHLKALIAGDMVRIPYYDFKTGKITFAAPFDRPYDWTKAGKTANFDSMLTPTGLAEIAKYADGVGPWKPYIVPVKGSFDAAGKMLDVNGDGAGSGHGTHVSGIVAGDGGSASTE